MPSGPSRSVEVAPLKGPFAPLSPNVSNPQPNLFGPTTWQLGGVALQTVNCPVGGITAANTATQPFSAQLTQLPSPIQLPKGAQGFVIVGCSLASPIPPNAVFSLPQLTIQFGNQQIAPQGFAVLQPGISYANSVVKGLLQVAAVGGNVAAITVQLTVWALLLGRLGP